MKSDLAKVLHRVNGQPMICILLNTLNKIGFERTIVVIGHQGEEVKKALSNFDVEYVWQKEQHGTGHAVMMARPTLSDFEGTTLVALGDVPFLSKETIEKLLETHEKSQAAATCLSAEFSDPTGYGRIVRRGESKVLERIVEHKDASPALLKIKEINSGTFCFNNQELFNWLKEIKSNNEPGEYYLTDVVKLMHDNGLIVRVVKTSNHSEVLGINSLEQLKELEKRIANKSKQNNYDTI